MRSFYTAALYLALIHSSTARVPHSFRDLTDRDRDLEPELEPQPQHGLMHWISRLFRRVAQTSSTISSAGGTCYEDAYYDFVGDLEPNFCQQFIDTPNVTVTVDYTPSTTTTVFTTYVSTAEDLTRVTPLSTLTVTETPAPSQVKRALAQADIDDIFRMFRRQNAANASSNNAAALSTSFTSACSCRDYPGSTVTATYTDEPVTNTLQAFTRTTTTSTRTTVAAVRVVSTTTLTAVPIPTSSTSSSSESTTSESSGGSGGSPTATTSSSAEATPTSPAYTCPDHNNTVVSQMVGNERFDYLVLCDIVLMDADLYSGPLNYATFGQCASACSIANANFSEAVCRGISYYATGTNSGSCFLKSASELRTGADGVDSAILQQILLGISPNSTAGTTTESAPFATPTITENGEQMSSMISNILSGSSNTMPMITPGPIVQSGMLVNAPGAMYSTFVTGGSTYSSGTSYYFSTQYSDGSYYFTYYSIFTQAWTSATTIYAAGDHGYQAENSTTNQYSEQSGNNGDYSILNNQTMHSYGGGWDNATSVLTNVTYNAENSQIASTATTYTNNMFTGNAASGGPTAPPGSSASGGSGGGIEGGGSGGPGSGTPATTTSTFSIETVIINSGGTSGVFSTGGSGGPGATPTPAPSATTMVNSYESVGSTGFGGSGGGSGISSATSTAASGGRSSSPSEVTVIVSSSGTVVVSSLEGSGGPSASLTPIASTVNSGGTSGFTNAAGSGGPNGTEGATSTEASGGPAPNSSTSTDTFTNSGGPRSGTYSRSSTPSGTAPPGTGSIPLSTGSAPTTESPSGTLPSSGTGPIPTFNSTGGLYTGPSSSTNTFTNSLDSRSGTFSRSSTPSGTAPTETASTSPSGPLTTGPAASTSANSTSPSGTGSSPSGSLPSGPSAYPSVNSTSPSGTGTAPLSTGRPLSTGTAPPYSSTGSHSDTGVPRSGTYSTTRTTFTPTGTYPVTAIPPLSTAPNTCSNITMGTTTVFSTTTVFGCWDVCPPAGTGGYGWGPNPFGPPGGPPLGPPGGRHVAGVRA